MLVDHRRLIEANGEGRGITHHIAHNGQVHDHHPRACFDARCIQWGDELLNKVQRDHMAQHACQQQPPEPRHPVYFWIGIFLAMLMFAIAVGVVIIVMRNV